MEATTSATRDIAVYGATGYTGHLVAAGLLDRGRNVILAGRDQPGLAAMAAEFGSPDRVSTQHAPLDDASALRELAGRAAVIVHCAGPFSVTGDPVATAAVQAGCHYIDHAVESHHVKHLFDDYDDPARRAGIVMVPSLSFYGGLGDLLSAAVTSRVTGIERVIVAYAVSGWRMTTGAKNTAAQLFAETERITFSDGAQHVGYLEPRNSVFAFPPPLGPRTMIAPFPSAEIVMIPRHVATPNVDLFITAGTFEEEQVFSSEDAHPDVRAQSDFTVACSVVARPSGAAGQVSGQHLWRAGVLASVEGAVRLADGRGPASEGVLSPAEAFPALEFLEELEKLGAFTLSLQRAAR
jgi:Saccharopine dehydrogenase NADP binding domain